MQEGQHGHVLDLVELGWVLLQHLILLHGHRLGGQWAVGQTRLPGPSLALPTYLLPEDRL